MAEEASPAAAAEVPVDRFDVKDFGAIGDDSHDDTAAIQAALDAALTAGGGTVYFPAGRYKVIPTTGGPALSVGGNGIRLVGASSKAAMLSKGARACLEVNGAIRRWRRCAGRLRTGQRACRSGWPPHGGV
ncbi:glycosyl hydrolase family 28-related protein [Actinomycetes bacterium KLBMP 9797]